MCDSKEDWYTQRKQDRQIFIPSASEGELLTPESPTLQFKQHSRHNEAHITISTDSTSMSYNAINKTALSCALYLV